MANDSPLGTRAAETGSIAKWGELVPGVTITVVKLAPDGVEAARYAGEIVATIERDSWVVVRATWTYSTVEMDGLSFCPGDVLLEWFSPILSFNAFAVFSPAGELRGWYANVTKPAYVVPAAEDSVPLLIWHDMYIDLVGLPDGHFTIRDLDELYASSLERDDSELFAAVLAAAGELQQRFIDHATPFASPTQLAIMLDASMNSSLGG